MAPRIKSKVNVCKGCGGEFHPYTSRPNAPFCSRICYGKGWRGKRNQGTMKRIRDAGYPPLRHKAGYVLVHCPDHPKSSRVGYVLEHRLIIEQHIGRFLRTDELIHHINGDKTDNRLENLEITTGQLHFAGHWRCPKCGHLMEAQVNDTDSVADDYQLGGFMLPSFGFI